MLALILSPIGRWLVGAAVGALLLVSAYVKGRIDEAAIDKTAGLRAQLSELQHQLRETKAVADAATERAGIRERETASIQEKVEGYEAELAKRAAQQPATPPAPGEPIPPPVCTYGLQQLDVERLRDILGHSPPGPPGRP